MTTRANARWDAIVKGEYDAAYAAFTAASREALSADQFKDRMRRTAFREGKVERVDCSADACTARVRVTYDHRLMKGMQTTVEETWVFDKGQPRLVYRS